MKKINFKKIFSAKNTIFLLFIFGAVFLVGHFASAAGFFESVANLVGSIIAVFIRAISSILILLVNVLMSVMAYSDFIDAPVVSKGWVVVRDLCNMFFVVVLLIIAFATILGQEEYGAKKFLPKLIMAAVLINFSKLICGLMIDVSSVVMLTFVNAFAAIGAGNILDMLGISEVTQIAVSDKTEAVTVSMIVSSYIFGLIYVVLATVVIAAMLGMLVVRLVMIWILVVLSPFAFFLQAVPGAGKYSSQWWSRWTSNLLVGPIIAFFLWLSFAALQSGDVLSTADSDDLAANNADMNTVAAVGSKAGTTSNNADMNTVAAVGSKAGTTSAMAKFVIAIGMLLGGMQIAQSISSESGDAMKKIFGKGKGMATAAGIGALTAGGKAAGRGALWSTGKLTNLASTRDENTGKLKGNKVGNFLLGWQSDLVSSNKKSKKAAANKYLTKLGVGDEGKEKFEVLQADKNFQNITSGIKSAAVGAFTGGFGPAFGLAAGIGGGVGGGLVGYFGSKGRAKNAEKLKDAKKKYNTAKEELAQDRSSMALDPNNQPFFDYENHRDNVKKLSEKSKLTETEKRSLKDSRDYIKDETNASNYKNIKENKLGKRIEAVREAKKSVGRLEFVEGFTGPFETFKNTKAAIKDSTKKKKQAKDWVNGVANNNDTINTMKKGEIYSGAGLSENWKLRFEELNGGDTTSMQAIQNLVTEIQGLDTNNTEDDGKLKSFAKAIAAFKSKDDKGLYNPGTLGQIESALISKGHTPSDYSGKVSTQYKRLGSAVEEVKDGAGSLQYDAFAKNSAKKATDRNLKKDIMGVSFEKINEKATSKGVDYKLDAAEGINQKVDGEQLKKLSTVMTDLIDDEIAALEKTGADINSQKISQLNTAKTRLQSGDLSGLSLKNTDVVYNGETDSERRRNEYNATQHETMHQYGARDEDIVDEAAGALQEAKLVGRIPKSDAQFGGKSYEEVLGKMIAELEQKGSSKEDISEAVASQIASWTPSNAQRVIETENGERETIKDAVTKTTDDDDALERATEAIKELTDSLKNSSNLSNNNSNNDNEMVLSTSATNFFYKIIDGVKKTIKKDDMIITDKLKPLSAMAVNEEKKSTNINDVL